MIESVTVEGRTFPIEQMTTIEDGKKTTSFSTTFNGKRHGLTVGYAESLEHELAATHGINVVKEIDDIMEE